MAAGWRVEGDGKSEEGPTGRETAAVTLDTDERCRICHVAGKDMGVESLPRHGFPPPGKVCLLDHSLPCQGSGVVLPFVSLWWIMNQGMLVDEA